MRKTLLLATILLLASMGAVQAQLARYELQAVPEKNARQGGLAEESAAVYVIFSVVAGHKGEDARDAFTGLGPDAATVTLRYSAPIMAGLMTDA